MLGAILVAGAITAAQPLPGELIRRSDYPSSALRENRIGVSAFRLTIGPDGKPSACEITGSSGWPDLDSQTCVLLMRRARFKPAKDSSGVPITGVFRNIVNWWTGEGYPPARLPWHDIALTIERLPDGGAAPALATVAFIVNVDGTMSDCVLVSPTEATQLNFKKGGQGPFDVEKLGKFACEQTLLYWKPKAAADPSGKPVSSIQNATLLFNTAR